MKQLLTLRSLYTLLAVVAWTLLVYSVLEISGRQMFSVEVLPQFWTRDFIAHFVISALMFLMARNFLIYAIAYLLLMTILHVSNGLKMAILGSPIMPDDFLSVRNMFMLFSDWKQWLMVLMLGVPLVALASMIQWKKVRSWISLSLIGMSLLTLLTWPDRITVAMDQKFGDWIWNQPGNYRERGLVIHLLQESARNISRADDIPDYQEVKAALATLNLNNRLAADTTAGFDKRNLHVILLESFWDPTLLQGIEFSEDPLTPEFRELWAQTGNSTTLSPVFGGYTANAEFEILCGFPVTVDTVFFEGWVRQDVPCLPDHLRSQGYQTFASHPNSPAFWNRVNVYRRIGFDTYWALPDFSQDDMNRDFLGDSSLYRQILEKLDSTLTDDKPVFNYIVTIFGHLDYPLNSSRPKVIGVSVDNKMLENYVNQMHYKSRELMSFLAQLQQRDPDSIIVMFGDHLPFLGPNFSGYTEHGLLESSRDNFSDEMFRTLTRTPLIIIDGKNGPVVTGELPLFRIPGVVLDLLGDNGNTILQLSRLSETEALRPLPGLHLVVENNQSRVCKKQSADNPQSCTQTDPLINAMDILTYDLFNGAQHALQLIGYRE